MDDATCMMRLEQKVKRLSTLIEVNAMIVPLASTVMLPVAVCSSTLVVLSAVSAAGAGLVFGVGKVKTPD